VFRTAATGTSFPQVTESDPPRFSADCITNIAWKRRQLSDGRNFCGPQLVQDITERSAVLGPLSDDELEAAYDFVLEHFALELLIGAHKNSTWSSGNLVIAANHRQIHMLQAAFYAVRLEVQRRKRFGKCV
jgi:hypothetical protein